MEHSLLDDPFSTKGNDLPIPDPKPSKTGKKNRKTLVLTTKCVTDFTKRVLRPLSSPGRNCRRYTPLVLEYFETFQTFLFESSVTQDQKTERNTTAYEAYTAAYKRHTPSAAPTAPVSNSKTFFEKYFGEKSVFAPRGRIVF